ncbi:hypothetical protein GCM10008942_36900 [Rhizomicrobium electricum]|uniref:Uncharacterized protein n=1 Tax=Rhizomicrobium electricum TaxID=480070 RepID=A0ABP3Q7L3_9PROT
MGALQIELIVAKQLLHRLGPARQCEFFLARRAVEAAQEWHVLGRLPQKRDLPYDDGQVGEESSGGLLRGGGNTHGIR